MTSISGALSPTFIPHLSDPPTDGEARDSSLAPNRIGTWRHVNNEATSDIDPTAEVFKRLAKQNPGALSLQVTELATQRQQQIAAFRTKTMIALGAHAMSAEKKDVIDSFEAIMTEENNGTVKLNGQILGKYADFMSELGALMVKINAGVTAAEDGKSNLNGHGILVALTEFSRSFSGERKTIGSFSNKADAIAFQGRFRGNTAELSWNANTRKYDVNFNMGGLNPILDAVANTPADAEVLKSELAKRTDLSAFGMHLRRDKVTSPTVQSLSLATSDVQKTFQTDLDLQINELSRSISQFDNLVKLFSSMIASLADTYKTFL